MDERTRRPWLLVLAGLPGVGKTTLAQGLAARTRATYLRVDAIETAVARVVPDVGPAGYVVAHELAASNLRVGNDVVVDAVNAVPEARQGWDDTARAAGAVLHLVEVVLPDEREHRRRVESRVADIPGHRVPSWDDVLRREWTPWDDVRDGVRTTVDATDARSALAHALALVTSG